MSKTKYEPMEDRLTRLNECFLSFGADPFENINRLTALCGELMGAMCALYNRLENDVFCVWGKWRYSSKLDLQFDAEGHACYDLIRSNTDELVVVRNLQNTKYADTDPYVRRYNLQTYVGRVVKFGNTRIGSLCVVYKHDLIPSDDDKRFMRLVAAAIGVEEKRKHAEDALRESEDRFRRVLDNSRDITYQLNLETGTYDYLSPSIFSIFGFTAEEIIAMRFEGSLERVHPDDIELIRKEREDFIASKDHLITPTMEYRYKHKDGHYIWVSTNRTLIRDDDGKPIALVANVRDVTEEKRTEEALRMSEKRMNFIFISAAIGICVADLEGNILLGNPRLMQILGYTTQEFHGRTWSDIVHLDDVQDIAFLHDELQKREPPTVSLEKRCICRNGQIIWVRMSVSLIPKMEEGSQLLLAFVEEITEHKQAQDALSESEKRYRGLIESQRDLIVRVTPDGLFTFVNDAYCRTFGKSADELLVTSFAPLVYEEDITDTLAEMEKLNVPPYRCTVEQRAMTVNGLRWFSWEDCAILNKSGQIVEIQAIGRDITERRNAELALKTAYSDLEKSYELQREFLNNVTHEVRTPLTAVKGYADMLLEGMAGPINEEQAMLLKRVLSSSQHLIEIVSGVLEMARLKSGSIDVRAKACLPCHFVDKAVSAVLPQAKQKGLNLSVEHTGKKCMGIYDADKIAIILINILSNAVKFTEHGSVEVIVDYRERSTEVIIADSGYGISKANLQNIFEEFHQLDYPGKHKPTGFGLGLAIVATMVETIGASLAVSSKEGIGTAFTLNIPTLDG